MLRRHGRSTSAPWRRQFTSHGCASAPLRPHPRPWWACIVPSCSPQGWPRIPCIACPSVHPSARLCARQFHRLLTSPMLAAGGLSTASARACSPWRRGCAPNRCGGGGPRSYAHPSSLSTRLPFRCSPTSQHGPQCHRIWSTSSRCLELTPPRRAPPCAVPVHDASFPGVGALHGTGFLDSMGEPAAAPPRAGRPPPPLGRAGRLLVMWGHQYTRHRRARDVRHASERAGQAQFAAKSG